MYIIRYGANIKISVAILDCVCSNVPTLAIRRDIDGQQFLKTKKQGAGIGEKKVSRGRNQLRPPNPPRRFARRSILYI